MVLFHAVWKVLEGFDVTLVRRQKGESVFVREQMLKKIFLGNREEGYENDIQDVCCNKLDIKNVKEKEK